MTVRVPHKPPPKPGVPRYFRGHQARWKFLKYILCSLTGECLQQAGLVPRCYRLAPQAAGAQAPTKASSVQTRKEKGAVKKQKATSLN